MNIRFLGAVVAVLSLAGMEGKAAGPVYPLKVDPTQRHLVDQAGTPVFINGDSPWSLAAQVSREDVELYLRHRAALGVNSLIVTIPEGHYCNGCRDAEGPRDFYGNKPFLTKNKFTTPNPRYFEHADWVIRKAGEYGMQVLLSPMYTGYDNGKETTDGWYAAVVRDNSVADCRWYGEWVGRHYRDFPNLLYVIGNDRDPGNLREKMNALAEGIRSQDTNHLITYHARPGHSSIEVWNRATYPWLTLNGTYLYGDVWQKSLEDYNRQPRMPFLLFESRYENEGTNEKDTLGTPQQVRLQAYASVLSGSCGHHYGNSPIWHMNSIPGSSQSKVTWKKALDDPGAVTLLPHIKRLFESRAWHTLVPDQDGTLVTRGSPIPAACTTDGATAIIYLPTQRTITVNLKKISGKEVRAWWYNPRDGSHSEIGRWPTTEEREFHSPSADDWVLVLDNAAKAFGPPGAIHDQELKAASVLRDQAAAGLRRAVEYFRKSVAVHGTYLWQYSEDLSKREGESVATATQGWVQPPGTPSVGMAFLAAHTATGDIYYLEAAREAAHGLVRGQLTSGGWTYVIEFDSAGRKKFAYRDGGKTSGKNVTTLDDDTTQAALRFLMRTDRALGFKDRKVHECVQYALECLLKAQYPNGAWPQGYDRFPEPEKYPVKTGSYPESWPRTWPEAGQYWQRYTLNDNALATTIETMFEAKRIYGPSAPNNDLTNLAFRCSAAALKAGDFLLLAQMPDPQPAWAQQYDFDMHPAWARKFEPPAVTGGESQGILRILLNLYRETGHRKYLEPIPRALDYLRRSRLPDGRLARFYELRSNKPLYFTADYQLTYQDDDVPTHYAFKINDGTDAIAREYERLKSTEPAQLTSTPSKKPGKSGPALVTEVKAVLAAQDAQGRWVEEGGLKYYRPKDPAMRVFRCDTFIRNLETLSRYLDITRE